VTARSVVQCIEVDAHPASRVDNSQPHGIGRVAALTGFGAWSNLGRNVVFSGPDLRPRAVFDESVFTEDEPSQYDLDVHAILEVDDLVLTLNHYGMVRAFGRAEVERPGPLRRVTPRWTRTFVADVERAVVADGRLLGSRPRSDALPGLLVSEPLESGSARDELDVTINFESWAMVTAMAAMDGGPPGRLAVGGDGRIAVVTIEDGRVRGPHWETPVDCDPAVLLWDGTLLWAAGSEAGVAVDDYDWDGRHGGGFSALDPVDGHRVVEGRFDVDLAWGNGGVAIALVPGVLCGFGRHGELQLFDQRDGILVVRTPPLADRSLGIAHGAAVGEHVLFGFNRGGYRLWAASISEVRRAVRSGGGRFVAGPG
jgi:hypothetical protein